MKSITLNVKLLLLWFLFAQAVFGQNSKLEAFTLLFDNVNRCHGNVFLDTIYSKWDTAELRKKSSNQLAGELDVITMYKMKLVDFDFRGFDRQTFRVRSSEEFYREKEIEFGINARDSTQLQKADDFYNFVARQMFDRERYDSLNKLQNLLFLSTLSKNLSDLAGKAKPKHMRLLSVYESDKMWMFIYEFMMIYGYPHYIIYSDIILK